MDAQSRQLVATMLALPVRHWDMRCLALFLLLLSASPVASADPIRVEFSGHFTRQSDPFDLLPEGLEVGNAFFGWFEYTEPESVDILPNGGIRFRIGFAFETEGLEWSPIGFAEIRNDVSHLEGQSDAWTGTTGPFAVEEIGTGRQVLRTIELVLADQDADQITAPLVPMIPTSLDGWETAQLAIGYDRVTLFPGYGIVGVVERYVVVPEPTVSVLMGLAAAVAMAVDRLAR